MSDITVFPARFAFYGTLRRSGGAVEKLGLVDRLTWIGPCKISGSLYRVSWYPALAPGHGDVVGDLFEVADVATVDVLDRFEGFDPSQPATSLYTRRRMTLVEPEVIAWVYEWNASTDGLGPIPSGDWLDPASPS